MKPLIYQTSLDAGHLGELDVDVYYEIDPPDPAVGIMRAGIIINSVLAILDTREVCLMDRLSSVWVRDLEGDIMDELGEEV